MEIGERLDSDNWRSLDADLMTQWFKERGHTLSEAERTEFEETLVKKMMEDVGELRQVDSQILKLESEMLVDIGQMKRTDNEINILEKQNIDHGRELESNGQNQDDLRQAEIQVHENLKNIDEIGDGQENRVTIEIEAPLQSADQLTSEITCQFEKAGYETVSTEIQEPNVDVETKLGSLESELSETALTPAEFEQPSLKKKVELEPSEMGNGEFG